MPFVEKQGIASLFIFYFWSRWANSLEIRSFTDFAWIVFGLWSHQRNQAFMLLPIVVSCVCLWLLSSPEELLICIQRFDRVSPEVLLSSKAHASYRTSFWQNDTSLKRTIMPYWKISQSFYAMWWNLQNFDQQMMTLHFQYLPTLVEQFCYKAFGQPRALYVDTSSFLCLSPCTPPYLEIWGIEYVVSGQRKSNEGSEQYYCCLLYTSRCV